MTRRFTHNTILVLVLAAIAGCAGASGHEEFTDGDDTFGGVEPAGEEAQSVSPVDTSTADSNGSDSLATSDEQPSLGTARQAMIKLRCCECTEDANGTCTAYHCGPCND
ncbi:MAG TPA: hypothetical protein VMG12_14815 [Polyangiaceae bacterium]|nr:hypothetical protein [Polyangiaceae bacterium]